MKQQQNTEDYFCDDVDQYTNQSISKKAFEECSINHSSALNYEEFKMFILPSYEFVLFT